PSQQQATRANALAAELASADRLAARDDARAVRAYRAVVVRADRLLAEAPRPDIADPVREMRERALRGVEASRYRYQRSHDDAPPPDVADDAPPDEAPAPSPPPAPSSSRPPPPSAPS